MAPTTTSSDTKVMRKGTRSCRSCRHRKIKCTWESATAQICNECSRHKRECISQGLVVDRRGDATTSRIDKADGAAVLRIRVNRMETMVERLAKLQSVNNEVVTALAPLVRKEVEEKRDENGCSFQRIQNSLVDGSELEEHARYSSPLFGLFNNEVVSFCGRVCGFFPEG
jgi:hypothetical protein